jgi:hypothetical protein
MTDTNNRVAMFPYGDSVHFASTANGASLRTESKSAFSLFLGADSQVADRCLHLKILALD